MSIDRDNFIKAHTVFPRSFLKNVKVVLSYPSLEGRKTGALVDAFLNNNFNISSDCKQEELFMPVTICAENSAVNFCFEPTECRLEFEAVKGYQSFLNSVFPLTRPLAEFAKDVVGDFGKIRISKENLWVIKTEAPESDLQTGLSFIFRPARVMELPAITVPADRNAWGVKTNTNPEVFPDIDCSIGLSVEYSDGALLYDVVVEAATKENVSYESFPDELLKLNAAAYYLYIDIVSDHVLKLMMKGN